MKKLFKKLFKKTSKSNEAISDLALNIFIASYALAEGLTKEGDYKDFSLFRTCATFCSGYINMTDRIAFSKTPEIRAAVIDQVIEELALHHIAKFKDEMGSFESPMAAMLRDLNSGQHHLGQFPVSHSDGNDALKGTFSWEFGKMFAKDLRREEDVVVIQLGIDLLFSMLETIKIKDRLLALRLT